MLTVNVVLSTDYVDYVDCRNARWLLVGIEDACLSTICVQDSTDRAQTLSAAYCCDGMWHHHRPTQCTELVCSTACHLHALISSATADHFLCVEPAQKPRVAATVEENQSATSFKTSEEEHHIWWQQLLFASSMAWAFQPILGLVHKRQKASLITHGIHSSHEWFGCANLPSASRAALTSLALGVGKSFFMEN